VGNRARVEGRFKINYDVLADLLGLDTEMEIKSITISPNSQEIDVLYRSENPVSSEYSDARTYIVGNRGVAPAFLYERVEDMKHIKVVNDHEEDVSPGGALKAYYSTKEEFYSFLLCPNCSTVDTWIPIEEDVYKCTDCACEIDVSMKSEVVEYIEKRCIKWPK